MQTEILMLHRILEDEPCAFGLPSCYRMRGTALTPSEFSTLLDRVERSVRLEDVEQALSCRTQLPGGAVFTFDDGYREHLDVAAPMLAERGWSGTFYVATGLHGLGGAVAPVDAWYWLLDHSRRAEICLDLPEGDLFCGRVDTWSGKLEWVSGRPKASFLSASPQRQSEMLAALSEGAECELPEQLAAHLYLRPEEWGQLVSLGMRVGAHSVSHPRLPQLDEPTLLRELGESISALKSLNTPVAFAYPDGAFDATVVAAARAFGVSSAVTCEPSTLESGAELMSLPRRFVTPGTLIG